MKSISVLTITIILTTQTVYSQVMYPNWMGGNGGGMGMGFPSQGNAAQIGNYNFQNDGTMLPVFDNGMSSGNTQYRNVKVNAKCPLLTSVAKDDGDIFSELKTFLSTASRNPKCSLATSTDPMTAMISQKPTISMLEAMLNGESSNSSMMPMGTSVSGGSVKCYTKNVELIGKRNMAYYYADRKMTDSDFNSPYAICLAYNDSVEMKKCIAVKYENLVEENKTICREMASPQAVQKQVNQGLIGVEDILNQALSNKDDCGFKPQELFKVTMNTFLKTKALSVVGPWGAVAGFGADIVGNLLDKLFPNDSRKATELMEEILSEETFEQNACLYFNIQQKMYCEDRPVEIMTSNNGCQNITVSSDLISLIQKYRDIKKVTDTLSSPQIQANPGMNAVSPETEDRAGEKTKITPEMETALLEHFDDLAKYTIASQENLKERVKLLPKMQQSKEQLKINSFIGKMIEYESYSPDKDPKGDMGKKIVRDIANFFLNSNADVRLDLSMFVVKTTPGVKLEDIRQRSIARTIEQMMALEKDAQVQNESSRVMARYNKYKTAMATLAKNKFESRLDKQFIEFEKQVKFVASKDKGIVDDAVAEGQLRNLVRHCSLLQEVYDPGLEGSIPKACAKLSCNSNKLGWFTPQKDKQNYKDFKQDYCDKSVNYRKTESDFVRELKDSSGAKICGVKAVDFF